MRLKKTAVERQVIVTWHTPDEKLPPEYMSVVVTFSGKTKNGIYSHALGVAECCHEYDYEEPAWAIEGLSVEDSINMHVEAWADLDAYGMMKRGGRIDETN